MPFSSFCRDFETVQSEPGHVCHNTSFDGKYPISRSSFALDERESTLDRSESFDSTTLELVSVTSITLVKKDRERQLQTGDFGRGRLQTERQKKAPRPRTRRTTLGRGESLEPQRGDPRRDDTYMAIRDNTRGGVYTKVWRGGHKVNGGLVFTSPRLDRVA
ncbi:hypothetical protein LX32DRAFT_287473 [Colletotrichum zoysiae]|uniref:Uncharacterized protein n=1 Tax=Colletotrichum zoysiae TaxID=1216348 RepID=A0AAD9HNQ6_9PEZI|nr:hypothetical protein LX32DRAFT_287473 [Colletotrichum zoysiae]